MRLLVDADPIVYRSGFAAESVSYNVYAEDSNGEVEYWFFEPKDGKTANQRISTWMEKFPHYKIVAKDRQIDAEPVENALQIVGSTIDAIRHAVEDKFDTPLDMRLVLSGPGNYRHKIATIRPYKGNRDPSHIPVHYQAIRNYLTDTWRARVIHGREADDEVSIEGWKQWRDSKNPATNTANHGYVVASIDKDLDQIPGWHYDYMKHVFYFVSEEEGRHQLWTQILAGDSGDNVPGCWKIGPDKAAEYVQGWIDAGLDDGDLWAAVLVAYHESKVKKGCPYVNKDTLSVALETAQLVYMQQRPGELWQPPGTEFGTVQGDVDD